MKRLDWKTSRPCWKAVRLRSNPAWTWLLQVARGLPLKLGRRPISAAAGGAFVGVWPLCLGRSKVMGELIELGDEEVHWPIVASILTGARFCAQHRYQRTASEDRTGAPWDKVNDDRLYRGLDVLGKHKDRLCTHLIERYRDWFGVNFEFLLYDVTSTFLKGRPWAMNWQPGAPAC